MPIVIKETIQTSTKARTQVLIEKGIIIAEGSRCCKKHLRGKLLDKAYLNEIEPTASDLNINRTGIIKVIESDRNVAKDLGQFPIQSAQVLTACG